MVSSRLDRNCPPSIHPVPSFPFPWPKQHRVYSGVSLWVYHQDTRPLLRLTLMVEAGTWYEPQPNVAYLTAKMLAEGTTERSEQALSQALDQCGAMLQIDPREDVCYITLTTLERYLPPMLALLMEVWQKPLFDAQRFQQLQQRTLQLLKLRAANPSYLAHQRLKETLFTRQHPYGRSLQPAAVEALNTKELSDYYPQFLTTPLQAFLCGYVTPSSQRLVQNALQHLSLQKEGNVVPYVSKTLPQKHHIPRPHSLQATLCIGRIVVSRNHPDYLSLVVLNTLLGGYFGSRLMRNLREDKGYTYGVHARFITLRHSSYWLIAADVAHHAASVACQEIYREMESLQMHLVSEAELADVRSYLLGKLIAMASNPFSALQHMQQAILSGLERDYYTQFDTVIRSITPTDLRTLAQKYLVKETFSEVIVS